MKKVLSTLLFLSITVFAFGQEIPKVNDSTYLTEYSSNDYENSIYRKYKFIDTLLYNIHQYDPIYKENEIYQDLGSIGHAYKSTFFHTDSSTDFNLGFNSFNKYLLKDRNLKYYYMSKPFTDLYWSNGFKADQVFNVIQTQNFGEGLNFGLNYRVFDGTGTYLHQESASKSFSLFTSIQSRDKKYNLFADITWDRMKTNENGGIYDDWMFEDSLYTRTSIPLKSITANRHIKNNSYYIKQYYNLVETHDSILVDTTYEKSLKNVFRISHAFNYNKQSYWLEDYSDTSKLYNNFYFNDDSTSDSTLYRIMDNDIALSYLNDEGINIKFKAKHQSIKHAQDNFISDSISYNYVKYFSNTNIKAELWNKKHKGILYSLKGEYVVDGINKGNYIYQGSISNLFRDSVGNKSIIKLEGCLQEINSSYLFNRTVINRFVWFNDFKPIKTTKLKLSYKNEKYKFNIGAIYTEIKDFVYYGINATPQQSGSNINLNQIYFDKDFTLGRFNFNTYTYYQTISGGDFINLPELATKNSFYINYTLFKKALYGQLGFEVIYHSSYFADRYMPATGQFYLQNEKEIGEYPFVNPYMNFKIKRARIFIKYNHANSEMLDYSYYLTPHYPMPERLFKFGLSWKFYN